MEIDLTFVVLGLLLIIVGAIVIVNFTRRKDQNIMGLKYCEKCGKTINEQSKFCNECGTPVGSSENNEKSIHTPQRSKSSNRVWAWLITIIGVITFFISLVLRGTTDYGYGQYPWMAQASFANSVDLAFNTSILLIVIGLVLVIISHIKKS